ncbi:hypothetical protein N665_1051s0007 [Sinapis alba]|nr:hypothetical protein N665_1051s0007 [Sinapis alba]
MSTRRVRGDSENKSGLPFKSFSEIRAGLSNTTVSAYQAQEEAVSLDFVRGVIEEDEGRRASGLFSHFHRPNLETNADIIQHQAAAEQHFCHCYKGNVKCKATSGSLPDLKGGRKMTSYTADATSENIGRRVKAMGLKSVNGFTHFKKKRNTIVAFRSGYSNSRNDQNPIMYIEDTTRKAHNGCILPRKRRV